MSSLRPDRPVVRYRPIEDGQSVEARLDASLVPPDRSLFDVALHRSLENWIFHVPATIAVLWLSTVVDELAVMLAVLLGGLVLIAFVPAVAALVLALPKLPIRVLSRRGRRAYGWFLATTVMAALDCTVYATCLFLLARAAGYAVQLPRF